MLVLRSVDKSIRILLMHDLVGTIISSVEICGFDLFPQWVTKRFADNEGAVICFFPSSLVSIAGIFIIPLKDETPVFLTAEENTVGTVGRLTFKVAWVSRICVLTPFFGGQGHDR